MEVCADFALIAQVVSFYFENQIRHNVRRRKMKTSLPIILASIVFTASFALAACPEGDLNRDCKVDLFDFALMAENWLEIEPNLPVGSVTINELLSHAHAGASDWIELYNTTGSAINIGGWYLSDNDFPLTKYMIPAGTIIPAYGYLVFYENTSFGTGQNGNIAFGFSENGETAYLSLLRDGKYFGMDDMKFDASDRNVSFGRYTTSRGDVKFVSMASNTPGQANSYPLVGPIVISEIMYNPLAGSDAEFVELHNVTNDAVPLRVYDPFVSGYASWKLTQGPNFDFNSPALPNDINIPANGYLIVARKLSTFTATYGSMPPGVQVVGPFANSTKLSNDGENVELSMPGDADIVDPNIRYYVRVDNVDYSDGKHHQDFVGLDPWPTHPDDPGQYTESLQRIAPNLFGDDVNNWRADAPTPGY